MFNPLSSATETRQGGGVSLRRTKGFIGSANPRRLFRQTGYLPSSLGSSSVPLSPFGFGDGRLHPRYGTQECFMSVIAIPEIPYRYE